MTTQQLLTSDTPSLRDNDSIATAAQRLLETGSSALPVTDANGRYLGLFSMNRLLSLLLPRAVLVEGGLSDLGFVSDPMEILCERMQEHGSRPVAEVIERDAPVVHPDTPLLEVVLLLYRHENDIPVVDDDTGRLLGMVQSTDLLARVCREANDAR